jgi:hypothetical protein
MSIAGQLDAVDRAAAVEAADGIYCAIESRRVLFCRQADRRQQAPPGAETAEVARGTAVTWPPALRDLAAALLPDLRSPFARSPRPRSSLCEE